MWPEDVEQKADFFNGVLVAYRTSPKQKAPLSF
jgi:hypothetical protein